MLWKSHKILSGAIAYTMGLPVEGIALVMVGSVFPDSVEYVFRSKHRGIFHFWLIYFIVFLLAFFKGFSPVYLNFVLKWFSFGCLLHILEDSMSKTGVPIFLGMKKRLKLKLYSTGRASEYVLLFVCVLIFFVIKTFKVKYGLDSWKPNIWL